MPLAQRLNQRLWQIACGCVCIALLVATGLKSSGNYSVFFARLEIYLGGDTVVHFVAALTCSTLLMMAVSERIYAVKFAGIRAIMLLLCLAFTVDEGLQAFSVYRQFSWGDLGFNYAGLLSASVLVMFLKRPSTWDSAGGENVH
ncbi:hypothetical protein [Agarivorans sp. DSG3-1]|uniref:hypothetical protein n=1 Tax=Agarivorans sp. DSG3-1 TaxID=3342249 RepID=UPI00398E59F4